MIGLIADISNGRTLVHLDCAVELVLSCLETAACPHCADSRCKLTFQYLVHVEGDARTFRTIHRPQELIKQYQELVSSGLGHASKREVNTTGINQVLRTHTERTAIRNAVLETYRCICIASEGISLDNLVVHIIREGLHV